MPPACLKTGNVWVLWDPWNLLVGQVEPRGQRRSQRLWYKETCNEGLMVSKRSLQYLEVLQRVAFWCVPHDFWLFAWEQVSAVFVTTALQPLCFHSVLSPGEKRKKVFVQENKILSRRQQPECYRNPFPFMSASNAHTPKFLQQELKALCWQRRSQWVDLQARSLGRARL